MKQNIKAHCDFIRMNDIFQKESYQALSKIARFIKEEDSLSIMSTRLTGSEPYIFMAGGIRYISP